MPASTERRRIFAFSGVLKPQPGGPPPETLLHYAISLAPANGPVRKVCLIPTAVGDRQDAIDHFAGLLAGRGDVEFSFLQLFTQPNVPDVRAHLLGQDVILVCGGSVVNLVAVWRAHGLPEILRECWEAGVVLAGWSAGSLCWHTGGPTDSFSDRLGPFTGGLRLVPYSNGVHDDFPGQPRREVYRALVAQGILAGGYATEDGTGLHYRGTALHEAVSIRPGKHAWRVDAAPGGGYREEPIEPRLI